MGQMEPIAEIEPLSLEEAAEYRRIRLMVLEMLEDWEKLRGQMGCPVMRHILGE